MINLARSSSRLSSFFFGYKFLISIKIVCNISKNCRIIFWIYLIFFKRTDFFPILSNCFNGESIIIKRVSCRSIPSVFLYDTTTNIKHWAGFLAIFMRKPSNNWYNVFWMNLIQNFFRHNSFSHSRGSSRSNGINSYIFFNTFFG